MKKRISIGYRHFWRGFNPNDNIFTRLLRESYEVEISDAPQFLFFSTFHHGSTTVMPDIAGPYVRIFYTAENCRPIMSKCEWAFSFDYDDQVRDNRHMRLPLYTYWGAGENLVKASGFADAVREEKRLFCNFVYSKDAEPRLSFFKKLSKYKKIDSPGRSMNTDAPIIPNPFFRSLAAVERRLSGQSILGSLYSRHFTKLNSSKIPFLRRYKFTIAFENSAFPGYTTEKIYHPMLSGSIPIYWGNPLVHRDFNPKSFVLHEGKSLDELVDRVIAIDRDDDLYCQMLREPWLHRNEPNPFMDLVRLKRRLQEICG